MDGWSIVCYDNYCTDTTFGLALALEEARIP